MVSHEQPLAWRRTIAAAIALAILAAPVFAQNTGKKFLPDDPLLREPSPRPVQRVAKRDVDDIYDFLDNSFITPRREGKQARKGPHPALDINTLGDVPENAWYSNRHYYRRMSIEELKRGPGDSTPPEKGTWLIVSAKSDGVTPGFVIEDARKNRYVLKFDPPEYPEMCSAADVIGSKAFFALGYNTPENYIVRFHLENLAIRPGVTFRDASGHKRRFTARMLDQMLATQPKRASDGTWRGLASRFIPGDLAGPFSYRGTRSDDPNDTIPHEDRRSLRGMQVFASWLNHHDTKAINSMDSLVNENGLRYLKHYLLDFGGLLGSDGINPKFAWSAHQYTIEEKGTLAGMLTFGFYVPRWARANYPKLTGVGRFDSWSFDPLAWKPNYPNPAFMLMDREDAFWAARQVAAFSDADIRALVETGEYSDPRAAEWVIDSLIKRRDKIAAAWFSKVLPLDRFRVLDGNLAFEDLGARRKGGSSREYSIRWATWDGAGPATPLPGAIGARVPAFRDGAQYLAAVIKLAGSNPAGDDPVTVYLRRGPAGPEVVGIDR